MTALRSKWAVGKGNVSAGRRIGVSASVEVTAFGHRYNDQEVSTELMMLCKRRHADTPIRRYVSQRGPATEMGSVLQIADTSQKTRYPRQETLLRRICTLQPCNQYRALDTQHCC